MPGALPPYNTGCACQIGQLFYTPWVMQLTLYSQYSTLPLTCGQELKDEGGHVSEEVPGGVSCPVHTITTSCHTSHSDPSLSPPGLASYAALTAAPASVFLFCLGFHLLCFRPGHLCQLACCSWGGMFPGTWYSSASSRSPTKRTPWGFPSS